MVIRQVHIAPHAVERMRQRVIPWATHWTDEKVIELIKALAQNRYFKLTKPMKDRVIVTSERIKFVFVPSENKIQTVLPHRVLTREEASEILWYSWYIWKGRSS